MKYGEIVVAKIIDKNDKSYFAQYQGVTFEVIGQDPEDSFDLGETVEGIIYLTMSEKKVIQLNLPDIRQNYFGWGTVVNSRKDLGVFVDVGLIDKDVVLSLDDLPDNRDQWPRKGDRLWVTFEVDAKNRFWAKLADYEEIHRQVKKANTRLMNQVVKATVFQLKLVGALAISKEGFRVFIHESEQVGKVRLGQEIEARIIKVALDGSLNGSMKPRAHEVLDDDAQMIWQLLEKTAAGFLPYHDKSDPQVILNKFGISKAQFKRALGTLLKAGKVRQEKEKGIYRIDNE